MFLELNDGRKINIEKYYQIHPEARFYSDDNNYRNIYIL